ncbi:MAG: hypothetical protein ABR915_07995 [Thermoguttaceae bacterium]|jgi:hypothetical protein
MSDRHNHPGETGLPGQVRLACPQCGQAVLVSWEKLGRRVYCRRCRQWYRLDRTGLIAAAAPREAIGAAVRSGFSEWRPHLVVWPASRDASMAAAGRAVLRMPGRRMLLALLVVGLALAAAAWRWRNAAGPIETAMPNGLEQRAGRWSEAWLCRDVRQMLQLVEPALDRDLRRWLARNPPPVPGDFRRQGASGIEVASVRRSADQVAEVTVQILIDLGDGRQQVVSQKQIWRRRGGVWYFAPREPTSVGRV